MGEREGTRRNGGDVGGSAGEVNRTKTPIFWGKVWDGGHCWSWSNGRNAGSCQRNLNNKDKYSWHNPNWALVCGPGTLEDHNQTNNGPTLSLPNSIAVQSSHARYHNVVKLHYYRRAPHVQDPRSHSFSFFKT
jgi:hypothetical protein